LTLDNPITNRLDTKWPDPNPNLLNPPDFRITQLLLLRNFIFYCHICSTVIIIILIFIIIIRITRFYNHYTDIKILPMKSIHGKIFLYSKRRKSSVEFTFFFTAVETIIGCLISSSTLVEIKRLKRQNAEGSTFISISVNQVKYVHTIIRISICYLFSNTQADPQ
jgi:hypothetical protein